MKSINIFLIPQWATKITNVFQSPRGMMKLKQKILTSNINIRETSARAHTHTHVCVCEKSYEFVQ